MTTRAGAVIEADDVWPPVFPVVLAGERQVVGQVSTGSQPSPAGEVCNDGAAGVTVGLDHVEQRGACHVLLVPAADRRGDTRE
jgi:hypothetical protein